MGSRKKPRHSLRSFGAPIPTQQQYHLQHIESILFLDCEWLKCNQRPFTSQHGEIYHAQPETHLITILYSLTTIMDIFRNTNLLRLGPILFRQPRGVIVFRTKSGWGSRLRRRSELHSKQGPDLRWNGAVEIQASRLAARGSHSETDGDPYCENIRVRSHL